MLRQTLFPNPPTAMAKGFQAPVRAAQVRATRDTAGAEYHRESKLHSLGRSVLYLFQQPQPQRISAVASTDPPTGGDALPPPKPKQESEPLEAAAVSRVEVHN